MTPWLVAAVVAAGVVGWKLGRAAGFDEAANLRLFVVDLQAAQNHAPCRKAIRRLSAALLETADDEALVAEVEQYLRQERDGS